MSARRTRGGSQRRGLEALAGIASIDEEIRRGLEDACRDAAVRALAAMWEGDVARLCGERWRPRAGIRVARAGACACEVTLAGRRVRLRRPRVRSQDGREIELATYRFVSDRDVLDADAIAAITAQLCVGSLPAAREGITRRFLDFVARELRQALVEQKPAPSLGLIFGATVFREHVVLVALGLGVSGSRRLHALQPGSSDNEGAVASLLRDVAARTGPEQPELLAVGEDAPLGAALRREFGASVPVYRCAVEKRRRVLGLLPAEAQAGAQEALRAAYGIDDEARARRALQTLARSWTRRHPRAAEALRDGLADTLTLHRLAASPARRRRAGEPVRPRPRARA